MTAPEPEVIAKIRQHMMDGNVFLYFDSNGAEAEDFFAGDVLAAYDHLATRCAAAEERADKAENTLDAEWVTHQQLNAMRADLTAARAQVAAMEVVVDAAKAYAEACKAPGQYDADGLSNADRGHNALIAAVRTMRDRIDPCTCAGDNGDGSRWACAHCRGSRTHATPTPQPEQDDD